MNMPTITKPAFDVEVFHEAPEAVLGEAVD
jgi:hypothetical protein